MICSTCGAVIEVGHTQCIECGAPVPETEYQADDLSAFDDGDEGDDLGHKHCKLVFFTALILVLIIAFGALAISVLYATREAAAVSVSDLPRLVSQAQISDHPAEHIHI